MEIKSFTIYDKDNGFECETDKHRLYLQLPDCPDSQHAFLDMPVNFDDMTEEQQAYVQEVIYELRKTYSNQDFCAYQLLDSITDYTIKYCDNWMFDEYCVILDNNDHNNYVFAKNSEYASYYNTTLINRIDDFGDHDAKEVLRETLQEMNP